ncbi:hypothetical protein CEXT_628781 [Caerostris extrusa]|uniref:Uncharacterized protein n=1 Tax=Caerostris extrusa TaxID=172846 RepID=A0AAV4PAU9_CAEEX|nr:hypothetical protein CEXT_628781 [Caerostris extrusa]
MERKIRSPQLERTYLVVVLKHLQEDNFLAESQGLFFPPFFIDIDFKVLFPSGFLSSSNRPAEHTEERPPTPNQLEAGDFKD